MHACVVVLSGAGKKCDLYCTGRCWIRSLPRILPSTHFLTPPPFMLGILARAPVSKEYSKAEDALSRGKLLPPLPAPLGLGLVFSFPAVFFFTKGNGRGLINIGNSSYIYLSWLGNVVRYWSGVGGCPPLASVGHTWDVGARLVVFVMTRVCSREEMTGFLFSGGEVGGRGGEVCLRRLFLIGVGEGRRGGGGGR